MNLRYLLLLAGMGIILTTLACSNSMQLAYPKPPAAGADKGEVSIYVHDERAPDRGGDDPLTVGVARNTFGMPFEIKAASNREPTMVVRALITDCLAAAGYKVAEASSNAPLLHAILKVFWSDGYQHSRMGLLLPMVLKQDPAAPAQWEHVVDINTGMTWGMGGFSQFNEGFNKMLEGARNDLIEEFGKPEFTSAYKSLE
jgi:hypothetical protein